MWCKSRLTGRVNWFNVPDANAGWSSLVARRAHNPKVGSSNLPPATKTFRGLDLLDSGPFFCGIFSKSNDFVVFTWNYAEKRGYIYQLFAGDPEGRGVKYYNINVYVNIALQRETGCLTAMSWLIYNSADREFGVVSGLGVVTQLF